MNKSHLLINEQALQVLPSLALALGLEEAIAIQQLHYWLNNPKNEGRIDEDGNKWVYNTYAEWKEDNFPFWSEDKIQRIFLDLQEQGVVIAKQLDAKRRDMKKFYRIDYDKLCAMDGAILRPSNTANPHDVKMNQRIPENTNKENFSKTSKSDIAKANPEWAIMAGLPVEQETLDAARIEKEAVNAFESAFGITRPWDWWVTDKDWRDLRELVVKEFRTDAEVFKRYVAWYDGGGNFKGGMNATQIKRQPDLFFTAWDVFKRQDKVEAAPQYKPFPEDSNHYVPNPNRRTS